MKYGFIPLLFMASALLITGVPAVQATVEENWPVGTPNSCRNADDFFMDFEAGIDDIEIESTIPSLKFTTTSGVNWRYADVLTGKYNVNPYGSSAYELNGNFGAWLGITGDAGRIDFLGGGATYCSVLNSTGSGLILDAYNSEDKFIATSGWGDGNTNTGTFTRLTVEAPAGENIAYVMIHDTGNFWAIDDLCTDANKAVIPVPGRDIGNHGDKFDIVFIPDKDYGSAADIDTWLPTFLDHINDQIDQRLAAADPVTGNLCKFNFYYTKMQGTAGSKTLPENLTLLAPFADAFVIFHTAVFGDSASMATPSIYGAEGEISAATQNGRSFIHESGHGIFRLADEYDGCGTYYFQPDPMPNIWATEALGRNDASAEGWDPDEIWKFTECQDDWWKLGTKSYIMKDGTFFANGWGVPGERRIQWFLDQFPACTAEEAAEAGSPLMEKSIWLNLEISDGVFNMIDESFVTDSAPNYLPGTYEFTIKVFSNGGALLGEYGIHDPRIIMAESDYEGSTWLDKVNFQLTVPYFNSCGRADLVESKTGDVKISVDLSQYATVTAPNAVCQDTELSLDGNGEAAILATDVDGGSFDPEGGTVELSIDKSEFTCADLGENTVTLTVTDEEGAPAACTATVTVEDTAPPVVVTQNITVQLDADGNASISVDDIDKGSTDNCCPGSKELSKSSFTYFDIGENTVTLTITDCNGNSSSATATVTVTPYTVPVSTTGLITDKPGSDYRDVALFTMTGVTDIETVAMDAAAAGTSLTFTFGAVDEEAIYSFTADSFDAAGNRMIYSDTEGNMVRCVFSTEICVVRLRYVNFDGNALDSLLPGDMTVSLQVGYTSYSNAGAWTRTASGSGTWTKYRKDS